VLFDNKDADINVPAKYVEIKFKKFLQEGGIFRIKRLIGGSKLFCHAEERSIYY
jgi:hypothetical protein